MLFIVVVSAAKPLVAADEVPPLDVVKQLVKRVLTIVDDKQMKQADKQKKLRELGAANLDFDAMSRMVLGGSWRLLSEDQQKRFVTVFGSFLEDAYLNKVQNYSDQDIRIESTRMGGRNFARVNGRIVQHGAEPIQIGFALRRDKETWKIYDIALDEVSTLHSYRIEFQHILHEGGFDELMRQIERRDRELASTLGSSNAPPF